MNTRRLSFGLLLTIAAMMTACGGDPPAAETPPQPTASPEPPTTATQAAEPPPAPTATAAPEPPPPPAKPAKEKIVGAWHQAFEGEVKDKADEAAKKAAGKKDPDNKKYNAALEKSQKAVEANTAEFTADTFTWSPGGKTAHVVKYEVANSTDTALSLKLGKDEKAKKDLKGATVDITFKDDNTIEMKDPFAKDAKKAGTVIYKKK